MLMTGVRIDNAGNGGVALSGSGRGGNAGSVIC